MPCEKLAAVLTPDVIAADPKLANVALLRTEWMNGLMFYLRERVDVTKGHVNYVDSGWAITSISEEQFWKRSLTILRRRHGQRLLCRRSFRTGQLRGISTARARATATPDEIATEKRGHRSRRISTTPAPWSTTPCCTRGSSIRRSSTRGRRTSATTSRCSSRIRDRGRGGPNRSPASTICSWQGSGSRPTRTSRRWRAPTKGGRHAANGVLLASGYSAADGQNRRIVPGALVGAVQGRRPGAIPHPASARARHRRLPLAVAPPVAAATSVRCGEVLCVHCARSSEVA